MSWPYKWKFAESVASGVLQSTAPSSPAYTIEHGFGGGGHINANGLLTVVQFESFVFSTVTTTFTPAA